MKPTVQLLQVLIKKQAKADKFIVRFGLFIAYFNSYILYENSYINSHILCEI